MSSFFDRLGKGVRAERVEGPKRKSREERARAITQGKQLSQEHLKGVIERQQQDFPSLVRQFSQQLNVELGQQVGQAQRQFEQQAGRRGLAFSGVEQAGLQAVRAQGQQQFARSLGEFEQQLGQFFAQERAAVQAGEFDFTRTIFQMFQQHDFDREIAQFQADIAADKQRSTMWGGIFQTVATIPFLPKPFDWD